jgi:hypothetical protein
VRVKSTWFRDAAGKSAAEQAGAMAFIVWRTARNMLDRMRKAGFDIDAGAPYFAFLREVLAFLTQVVDRDAYRRLDAAARAEFTTVLVRRVAEILDENESDLLGVPPQGAPGHADRFIDLVNELAGHYAEFGADAAGPDFAFVRYLGSRIEPILPAKDRRWVLDQVMAAEAPEAVEIVQRAMRGLFSTEPRAARRATMSGE